MKNAVSGMLRRVSFIITDISEEHITSIIIMTTIGELGTTLALTKNRSPLRKYVVINSISSQHDLVVSYC
jgi:hypothetical protein